MPSSCKNILCRWPSVLTRSQMDPIVSQPVPSISVGGVAVSMVAFQAIDPGSTPGWRTFYSLLGTHCPSQRGYLVKELFVCVPRECLSLCDAYWALSFNCFISGYISISSALLVILCTPTWSKPSAIWIMPVQINFLFFRTPADDSRMLQL